MTDMGSVGLLTALLDYWTVLLVHRFFTNSVSCMWLGTEKKLLGLHVPYYVVHIATWPWLCGTGISYLEVTTVGTRS